jgi:3-phenylpropionate/trans-cinnamate dioxygenase ferredoxin subunit
VAVPWEKVATTDEVAPGGRLAVVADDVPVLLFRLADGWAAIEDVCTHDGQPLTDGAFDGCAVTCPRHGARFDVRSGRALCMPATEPVRTFDVEVRGSEVWLRPAAS